MSLTLKDVKNPPTVAPVVEMPDAVVVFTWGVDVDGVVRSCQCRKQQQMHDPGHKRMKMIGSIRL